MYIGVVAVGGDEF